MRTSAAIAALLLTAAPAMAQDAATAFSGRSLAMALDDRCELYSAAERSALDAAWLQARSAMIRTGYRPDDLTALAAEYARRAQPMACGSDNAQAIAADVAAAFQNWLRVREMDFPGADRVWHAARPYPGYPAWTLAQYPVPGDASRVFGYFHTDGSRALAIGRPAESGLSTARIIARDVASAPELNDVSLGGLLRTSEHPEWVRHAPPAHAQSVIWASRRVVDGEAMRFEFPERAAEMLRALDPRETVRIELLDRRGHMAESFYVEVGDFAAGRAFLIAGDSAPSGATGG